MLALLKALFYRLTGRREPSGKTAKRRLQLVLVNDRTGLAPQALENLKNDIIRAIARYLVLDEASIQVEVRRTGDTVALLANIQVRDVVRAVAE